MCIYTYIYIYVYIYVYSFASVPSCNPPLHELDDGLLEVFKPVAQARAHVLHRLQSLLVVVDARHICGASDVFIHTYMETHVYIYIYMCIYICIYVLI